METTPVLFGSNCAKTRSNAATSSPEGSSASFFGSILLSFLFFLSSLSESEEEDDDDEDEDEEDADLRTKSSLSLAMALVRHG